MFFSFAPFLLSFWFVRSIKQILFWIYLWQLKQYHIGRFLDHFKTEKGKKLIFQPIQALKLLLVVIFLISILFYPTNYLLFLPLVLFLIYFFETLLYFKGIFSRRVKNPEITKKTIFLTSIIIFATIICPIAGLLFINSPYWFSFLILIFDILIPVIVSLIIILFQPLADYYRLSLQKRAKEKISKLSGKNLTIIAITGSYGKTSTKEYLATILSQKFKVLSTPEHRNTEVGIPQCILNDLNPEHEIFIVEMGAYDKGTIKRICDFVQPEIGIVTGVNAQHLALFGSMENLLSAEGGRELLKSLPIDGLLIVNGENEYCMDLYKKADVQKIAYKLDEKLIKNIDIKKNFSSFSINDIDFKVDVLGRHNVLNLVGAVLAAKELGMTLREIAGASEKITIKNSSFKITKNKEDIYIIDSTYSANPDGVIADLEYLEVYPGKKVIVMPCLIELGEAAKEAHQKIGRKIAEICDLAIITADDYYQDIRMAAIKNGMKAESINLIEDNNLIVEKIKSFCKPDDVILLEGRLQAEIIKRLS